MNRQKNSNSSVNQPVHDSRLLVLVVDDEPAICWAFERLLQDEGYRVLTASSAEEGLRLATEHRPHLVLLDVRLPKEDGISALPKFLLATENTPVVIMTAFGDLETAVAAVRNGASDYLTKPFRLEEALRTCRNAMRTLPASSSVRTPITKNTLSNQEIIGRSAAIQQAFRQIALVAASDLSVVITGETGTGKELVAAAIHRHSRRCSGPYLPIAPVALNPDLIESELFGHVKGAFTGALDDRSGLFERAGGGTVLLDEIGDLPLSTQVKLLRVLEQGDYCRVGDTNPRRCDVRIITATNCDLRRAVSEGRFREDLYYRLNGLQIHLPPLRERSEDIKPLCDFFLRRIDFPQAANAVDDELMKILESRPWFGNVRELKNALEHAAVIARGRPLAIEDFPALPSETTKNTPPTNNSLEEVVSAWTKQAIIHLEPNSIGLQEKLFAAIEPALLGTILNHTGGNRAKAAEILGIHRGTLRERLRQCGYEE